MEEVMDMGGERGGASVAWWTIKIPYPHVGAAVETFIVPREFSEVLTTRRGGEARGIRATGETLDRTRRLDVVAPDMAGGEFHAFFGPGGSVGFAAGLLHLLSLRLGGLRGVEGRVTLTDGREVGVKEAVELLWESSEWRLRILGPEPATEVRPAPGPKFSLADTLAEFDRRMAALG